MYLVTPEEMRSIDKRAIEEFGIPGIVLMENAAIQTARFILERYLKKPGCRAVILVGSGNNGGDGLAVARHLFLQGMAVEAILLSDPDKLTGDARTNFSILSRMAIPYSFLSKPEDLPALKGKLQNSDLVVDAIFGTGLSKPIEGLLYRVIETVNECGRPVVAVDIPSGIHGKDGRIMGIAIKADATVTFGYLKRGHLLYPGRQYSGFVKVVPISLPGDSAGAVGVSAFTLSHGEAARLLRERPLDGHKGTFGRVAVLAGSTGLTGAATLTSLAAIRSGAGLVTLGIPGSLNEIMENKLTEVMTLPLEDRGTGHLVLESVDPIMEFLQDKDVLALGPGLGKSPEVFEVMRHIFGKINISIVLDADGINHISREIGLLDLHAGPTVITPHPGEMARLTGKPIEEVLKQPVETACETAERHNVIVLLKGATSIAAHPDGRLYLNRTGNSGMATGGSGDVLTGLIASLIAQGYDAFDAAVLGCFIHGFAGDLAAEVKGGHGMIAGDILEYIPSAFKELIKLCTRSDEK